MVFGEFIILLELDKWEGGLEVFSIFLLYLKIYFLIFLNLYLIGIMNIVDCSVESWDLVLRRRFIFKELDVDFVLIFEFFYFLMVVGIDLMCLLEIINVRLG